MIQEEVKKLVNLWFKNLDVHAPLDDVLSLLADENLEMKFPEATLKGKEKFKDWYETVTHKFFDETHELMELNVELNEKHADVNMVVNWQAKMWTPPEARSKWLGFNAVQTWVITESNQGKLIIQTYIVDSLTPMDGSATL